MKKSFWIYPALCCAAAAVAFAQAQPANRPSPAAAPAVAPTRVAVINIQEAILGTKDGQKAAAELQARFNPRKSELEKRGADIQGLQDQLKKGGATMSDAAKEKIVRDIDAKTRSLNHDGDDLNAEVEQEQNKVMGDLGQKMMAILDQYAAQRGVAVVLDVSNQQSPVFWAAPATIVTADIVKLYDQAHPGTAAAAPAKPPASKAAVPPAAPRPNPPAPPAGKKQ